MTRTTIDFGIDLGTTNSAIAMLTGVTAEIVKNNDDRDTTPSAIWIDRRNRLYVGQAARDRCEIDPENTCVEFKLLMGTAGQAKRFRAAERTLTPEELSAEVLKSLRADVRQRTGEDIRCAAVTVPAAFDLSACDATRRAARLAGLELAPLLQEPTAAALAYGFQSLEDDAVWLVYDLGGGTFDASIVQLRDGEFSVINHCGDNYLGGKLIDWKLVEEILLPAVAAEPGFSGVSRREARWAGTVSKLKLAAEAAKIRLSRTDRAAVVVELDSPEGRRIEFEHELTRAEVERLAGPFIVRSINLCRRALEEAHLDPAQVAKVILVGGPTLSPYLRQRLADPADGLGIPLDHSQDPMTAVARGAAIFAGTQRIAGDLTPPPGAGFAIQLEYDAVGPDTEPLVAGKLVSAAGQLPGGLTVELVRPDARPPWRSGRIPVGAGGGFTATLWADRGGVNTFRIEVQNAAGDRQTVVPDRFGYTVGAVETQPALTHSVAVGLAGNQVRCLMQRGTALPARRRVTLRTAVDVRSGHRGGVIRIPVLEGEHARADRNRRIGRLEVTAAEVARDVPEGSEVELTVEIDASRTIQVRAYLPLLDEQFESTIDLNTEEIPTYQELVAEMSLERRRLDQVRSRQEDLRSHEAGRQLDRIAQEHTVTDVESLVDAARVDPDAATAARQRILDLRAAVDQVADALAWPVLVREAEELVRQVGELVAEHGDDSDRRALLDQARELRAAIDAGEAELVQQRCDEMRVVTARILDRGGLLQVMFFESLAGQQPRLRDQAQAARLIEAGRQALVSENWPLLRNINAQLQHLMPVAVTPPDPFSTVRQG